MCRYAYQTAMEGRIYSLLIVCGPSYPDVTPDIRFQSAVAMDCVGGTGEVDIRAAGLNWVRDSTIENAMVAIKNSMGNQRNRRQAQPPEGAMF